MEHVEAQFKALLLLFGSKVRVAALRARRIQNSMTIHVSTRTLPVPFKWVTYGPCLGYIVGR